MKTLFVAYRVLSGPVSRVKKFRFGAGAARARA